MDTAVIVLIEQPKKVHTDKLAIKREALGVSKEYILKKWPDIWSDLQSDFKEITDIEPKQNQMGKSKDYYRGPRKECNKKAITDVEPKHLDIINFSYLLQNADHSSFCKPL